MASTKKTPGGEKPVEQSAEAVQAQAPAAAAQPAEKPPLDLTKLKVEKSCSRGLTNNAVAVGPSVLTMPG